MVIDSTTTAASIPASSEQAQEPTTLQKKKNHLKSKLASGIYEPLPGMLINSVARFFHQRLGLKEAPPSLFSALLIALLTFLVGWGISLALNETLPPLLFEVSLGIAAMGGLVVFANKTMIDMFLSTFQGSPVEAIKLAENLDDLEKWLNKNFDYRLPLLFSAVAGPLLGIFLLIQWNVINGIKTLYIGPLFIFVVAGFLVVISLYYLYPLYLVLPNRLSRYKFDMYKADPSSSEVTIRLSNLFTTIMYITIVYLILVTTFFAALHLLNQQTIISLGVLVWAPTVGLYLGCQFNLSKVITNSKWDTLNEIQASIESLQASQAIPSAETLEHLDKLMNYHDRILATPNSALNVRSSVNALNSILLPLITLILANWETIRKLLPKF